MFRLTTYLTIILLACLTVSCGDGDDSNTSDGQDGNLPVIHTHKMDTTPVAALSRPVQGEMITFKTGVAERAYGYLVRAKRHTNKYLLVFHEWWGLNDYIKKECDYYCNALGDVNVLGIDLYDGRVTDDPKQAAKFKEQTKDSRMQQIIKDALLFTGDSAKLATLGWCFGGHWSLEASIDAGDRAIACVIYYGEPEKNMQRLQQLSAPVLGIFGDKDKVVTPQMVNDFENRMNAINKPLRIQHYNEEHAFANPSNPKYNNDDAADAKKLTVRFLKEQFAAVN
jgi:carboxymethylenebutenolidase